MLYVLLIGMAGIDDMTSLAAELRPADLPVQQSTKVELMINLKTAKARSASPCRPRCSAELTR